MKQKSKFRRFWNLDHRKSDGFTLVELIVVIAILAVLGGATVPAYNLYVKKARESADQQILAAVNNAFASACLESKIDVEEVGSATISVIGNSVNGLSSIAKGQAAARNADPRFNLDVIDAAFRRYYEGNEAAVFVTENVNSLNWIDGAFEISQDFVDTRILMNNGKVVTISKEDMANIMASAYADMGYSGVKEAVNNVGKSAVNMANLLKNIPIVGKTLVGKLTNVLVANKLIDQAGADALSPNEIGNGLQMVTAKYLANAKPEDIRALATLELNGSTYGMVKPLADGTGGTVTVSAAAMQYALIESFANNPEYKNKEISMKIPTKTTAGYPSRYKNVTMTVSDYLASDYAALDPVAAIEAVQNTNEYKSYQSTDQYQKDIDGFVGTMSILGDNIGTTSNPGAVDINEYFSKGIESSDAENILTEVIGPGA